MSAEQFWPDVAAIRSICGTDGWREWEPFVRALVLARYPETLLRLLDGEKVELDELDPHAVSIVGFRR